MAEKKQQKEVKVMPEKKVRQLGEKKIAIVKVRGSVRVSPDVKKTLELLRLQKGHICAVINDNPGTRGMVQIIKDYVAYGEIDEETHRELEAKRKMTTPHMYRLHPPRGGFPRKGVKLSYQEGGALGNWGANINKLIKKML